MAASVSARRRPGAPAPPGRSHDQHRGQHEGDQRSLAGSDAFRAHRVDRCARDPPPRSALPSRKALREAGRIGASATPSARRCRDRESGLGPGPAAWSSASSSAAIAQAASISRPARRERKASPARASSRCA